MERKTCPKCGQAIEGFPAISRLDNETEICPECGLQEALDAFCKRRGADDPQSLLTPNSINAIIE